jgi:predicted outer membrane repeat protein
MKRTTVIATVVGFALLAAGGPALASANGIWSFSGNPATQGGAICTMCHSGGAVPLVTLAGPTVVDPGTVNSYVLTIRGGQQVAGGLDVSVTGGSLIATDPLTQILNSELAHTMPKNADSSGSVSWGFRWQAPATAGSATRYGAGNSVNNAQGSNGDNAAAAVLDIMVGAVASSPGETSSDVLAPLIVTSRDPVTGVMDLGFESSCEVTDNNIYYGPFALVSTLGYSGESCLVGSGPAYPGFDPGSGSFFFLVVGNKATDEGSYGLDRVSGVQSERPEYPGNGCGVSQTLSDRCD